MCFRGLKTIGRLCTKDLGPMHPLRRHGPRSMAPRPTRDPYLCARKGQRGLRIDSPIPSQNRIMRVFFGGARAMAAWAFLKCMGLPIGLGQRWGRWGSRRVVAGYIAPPPTSIFTRGCRLPWLFEHGGLRKKMVSAYGIWPKSITEYFMRNPPQLEVPKDDFQRAVGTKRATVDKRVDGAPVPIGKGVWKPTRCQRKVVNMGVGGDKDGKDAAIMVD